MAATWPSTSPARGWWSCRATCRCGGTSRTRCWGWSRSSWSGLAVASNRPVCWPPCCSPTSSARPSGLASWGDQGWRELLDTHDELAGRLVERWGGRLVTTTGDGILATFDGPGRAIGCAVTLRDELHGIGTQIRARLHAGELELRGDNIGGIAVNIAARIMATAGAGEIIVSRTVRDLVAGSGVVLQDRGSQRLRSVEDEWELSRWSAGRFGSPPRRQHVGASAATTMGRSATWSCRRGTRCGSPIAEPPTITMRPAEAAAGRAAPGGAARLDLAGRDDPNLAGAGAAAPAGLGGRSTGPPHVWVHDLS